MTTTKHTPGPWDWRDRDDLRQAKSTRDDGRYGESVLCAGYDYDRGAYLEISDLDARLIAAAPALLEALEWLDTLMDFGDELRPFTALTYDDVTAINAAFAAAKAAIKLARGEP